MKKILLFLSLLVLDGYAFAKAYKTSCINMIKNYFSTSNRVSSDSIIPVKLECFITKIYIFERYGIWAMFTAPTVRLQFLRTAVKQNPIVLKK